jgi:hypothetical protein
VLTFHRAVMRFCDSFRLRATLRLRAIFRLRATLRLRGLRFLFRRRIEAFEKLFRLRFFFRTCSLD